jgi:hypothetical protein
MKKAALAVLVLAAFAAACHDPRPDAPPNYDATRRDSQKAQNNLDNANGN